MAKPDKKNTLLAARDMIDCVGTLSSRRPVFHSEADFQHELAWDLRRKFTDEEIEIRLERPVQIQGRRCALDMFCRFGGESIGVELKYKTRKHQCDLNGERFDLAQHAATPLGRYDILADVERLERLVEAGSIDSGYVVAITNEPSYWSTRPARGNGAAFSLHEGNNVPPHTSLEWEDNTNAQSLGRGRVDGITLRDGYHIEWRDYSGVGKESMRWLMFHVRL
jgi:hypothetical protein